MIIDRIATLQITISLVDLQNLLVIRLARVKLDLRLDVAFIFARKTATINLVAMAKFFYIIYKRVLLFLLANRCHDEGLLGPILTYFGIVKTGVYGMLYLHCLVWLKGALHLPNLYAKIQGNKDFGMRLLAF